MTDYYDECKDEYGRWHDPDAEGYHTPNLDSFFEAMEQNYKEKTDIKIDKAHLNFKLFIFIIAFIFIIIILLKLF